MDAQRVAVIDIGSNSSRIVIMQPEAGGHLEVIDEHRAPLRLARELDADGALSPAALQRVAATLFDFVALAHGAGASRVIAVATAAVRQAVNREDVVARAHGELGLDVRVIDAEQEAHAAFAGAVYGLPADHGVMIDIGGGSLQLAEFRERRVLATWSLRAGALVLAGRFLASDPPTAEEVAALREFMDAELEAADVPALAADAAVIGTGGSIRNLAKIDRKRRNYPIDRLHGYAIRTSRAASLAEELAGLPLEARRKVVGLNPDRADSIAAGALALRAVLQRLHAREVVVAGQGLREGLARGLMEGPIPPAGAVRRASVEALLERFVGIDREHGPYRADLSGQIAAIVGIDPEIGETLEYASRLLDIGIAIDFYNRHKHTANIVLQTDLHGFSHEQLVQLSALIRFSEKPETSPRAFAPLLAAADVARIQQAAVVLAASDTIVRRVPPGHHPRAHCHAEGPTVHVRAPGATPWSAGEVAERFLRAFGRGLVVEIAPL